jgi:hypothetical protein
MIASQRPHLFVDESFFGMIQASGWSTGNLDVMTLPVNNECNTKSIITIHCVNF